MNDNCARRDCAQQSSWQLPGRQVTRYGESGFNSVSQSRDLPSRAVISLHFSPRGEVKCVRGPSGRGSCSLARTGVAAVSPHSAPGSRNTQHGLYGSPAVRHFFWSEPGHHQWFSRITRHETRITAFFACFGSRVASNAGQSRLIGSTSVTSAVAGQRFSCANDFARRRVAAMDLRLRAFSRNR